MFQRIVLTVAIIILIITLAIMGILMFNHQSSVQWPPEVSTCPDYFTATSKNVCQNTEKIKVSNTNCNTGNFSGAGYRGKAGDKRKCQWAKECGVSWDGISTASPPYC